MTDDFRRYATGLAPLLLCSLLLVGTSTVCGAVDLTSKLQLNAYLTQAFGITDGTPLLGLTEDGTADYRSAALLFRANLTAADHFIIQLSHEALAASPTAELKDSVELDWAFYQHHFGNGSRVRVGRLPIAFGIYNQLRDVGTVLEFFRPPVAIYFEGAFASETVDGLELSHPFELGGGWSLETTAYLGSWDRSEFLAPDFFEGKAEDAFGVQLWLDTPAPSLRFGFAYQQFDQTGGIPFFRIDSNRFETYLVSIDAEFGRFVLHAEGQQIETFFVGFPEVEIPAYYALVGYRPNEQFGIYMIYEDSWSELNGGPFPPLKIDPFYQDLALSLVYNFRPQTLLRLELHHAETTQADIPLPISGEPYEVDYAILSLSASF